METLKANKRGMSWQEAKDKAEKHIDEHKYPGLKKLVRIIGCAPNTLRRAVKNSKKLSIAKERYENPQLPTLRDKGLEWVEDMPPDVRCLACGQVWDVRYGGGLNWHCPNKCNVHLQL